MQIDFYRALRSAKIGDDTAQQVVKALEEHIAMKIQEANKGLREQMKITNILLAFLSVIMTISAAIGGYAAFIMK